MAHIHVVHTHRLGREEAKEKVLELLPQVLEKVPMSSRWTGDTLHIDGSGVKGTIAVGEKTVTVKLRTSLLLRPFCKQIEAELRKQFAIRF